MMIRKYLHIALLFLICFTANESYGQESKTISESEFETYNNQLDYDKTSKKLKWKKSKKREPIKKQKKRDLPNAPNLGFLSGLGGIFRVLAYLLIAIMACAMIYIIFSNVQVDEKLSEQVYTEIDLEEEHIEDVDVESEYEKALRLGDYRMALRMRFLMVLQQLSLNNDIDWKYEKTNRDYASELRGTSIFSDFKTISGIFEWVWYGNHEISKEEFDHYATAFNQFKTQPV